MSTIDTAKASLDTKHCRDSYNEIKRLHRASYLKVRTTSIMPLPSMCDELWKCVASVMRPLIPCTCGTAFTSTLNGGKN